MLPLLLMFMGSWQTVGSCIIATSCFFFITHFFLVHAGKNSWFYTKQIFLPRTRFTKGKTSIYFHIYNKNDVSLLLWLFHLSTVSNTDPEKNSLCASLYVCGSFESMLCYLGKVWVQQPKLDKWFSANQAKLINWPPIRLPEHLPALRHNTQCIISNMYLWAVQSGQHLPHHVKKNTNNEKKRKSISLFLSVLYICLLDDRKNNISKSLNLHISCFLFLITEELGEAAMSCACTSVPHTAWRL